MTSIVNFEEKRKMASPLTDEFFTLVNRIHDAKLTGSLMDDEYSKLLILENKFFANLVKRGKKTEEDVETYENDMPSDKFMIGNFNHKDIKLANDTIRQANTAALLDADKSFDGYSKGLRKVA